jgi:hypothetical protein
MSVLRAQVNDGLGVAGILRGLLAINPYITHRGVLSVIAGYVKNPRAYVKNPHAVFDQARSRCRTPIKSGETESRRKHFVHAGQVRCLSFGAIPE